MATISHAQQKGINHINSAGEIRLSPLDENLARDLTDMVKVAGKGALLFSHTLERSYLYHDCNQFGENTKVLVMVDFDQESNMLLGCSWLDDLNKTCSKCKCSFKEKIKDTNFVRSLTLENIKIIKSTTK